MSSAKKITKNALIIFAGDIASRLISLFVIIFLARYLGVEQFGTYNFVFAFLTLFSILKNLGLHDILAREMACNSSSSSKLIGNVYVLKIILSLFSILLCITVTSLLSYPKEISYYIYVASLTILFTSFSDFYSVIFQVNYRMDYNIYANLIFKFVFAISVFLIIYLRETLMFVFLAIVLGEMIKTAINYHFSKKFVKPRFELDYGLLGHLIKEASPIALTSVISIIYYRTDVIMLSVMLNNSAVGIYSAAYKLVEPLSLIATSLAIPLFAYMSSVFKSSRSQLLKARKMLQHQLEKALNH